MVQSGTFDNLYVGDMISIGLHSTCKIIIAGFNLLYNQDNENKITKPHILWMLPPTYWSDNCIIPYYNQNWRSDKGANAGNTEYAKLFNTFYMKLPSEIDDNMINANGSKGSTCNVKYKYCDRLFRHINEFEINGCLTASSNRYYDSCYCNKRLNLFDYVFDTTRASSYGHTMNASNKTQHLMYDFINGYDILSTSSNDYWIGVALTF